MLIAVAPNKLSRGVETAADDWRTKNARKVRATYTTVELEPALAKWWLTDAHFVTYIVRDPFGLPLGQQPRINKVGLTYVEAEGFTVDVSVLVCDVDNPGHAEWDDVLRGRAIEQHTSLPILETTGVYATKHGRRILQPIATPIPARDAEPYIERWLGELEAVGVAVDWSCRDWTRHFRLPHVQRNGMPYRSPWVEARAS